MNKKKGLFLSILGIISLVLITAGVTYAFFSYTRQGTTDNTIETGTITFIYEEVEKQGAGISIEDAYPMSDDKGMTQSGSRKVFNFKVKSTTISNTAIPYTVTARMKDGSTLDQDVVKIYLTDVVGDTETKILLDTFDQLPQTTVEVPENTVEKVIYTGEVPAKSTNYEKNFRLRMWIKEGTDFSGVEQEDGTVVYPYNDKEFSITVNVYANAEVVNVPETTTYTSYNIGDSVTAKDGSKWHVLEASDENTETVVLLSDYNLNTDGTYNTTCGYNINGETSCSPMKFDSDNTNIYDESDSNNIGYFIKNTYMPKVVASLPGTTNITLPTAYQIASADGQVFNNEEFWLSGASWLTQTDYWTRTDKSSSTNEVWMMAGAVYAITPYSATSTWGARPVITTPKSNLISE